MNAQHKHKENHIFNTEWAKQEEKTPLIFPYFIAPDKETNRRRIEHKRLNNVHGSSKT